MLDERRADLCNYRMKNSEDSLTVAKDCLEKGMVVAYFNRTYAATEKIPREIGRKLTRLQQKREKSDYDDFYIASKEETMEQIENTKSVISAVKDYLSKMEIL